MKIAIVFLVTDFEYALTSYGLEFAFECLAKTGLSEPIYVPVAEGFEKIPKKFIERWGAENIRIEDCSKLVGALYEDYPWLKGITQHAANRIMFLRHLILEKYFDGEGTVTVDADIIWRVNPYEIFGSNEWKYLAPGSSGCLVYVNSREWFEAFRAGLEEVLAGGALISDYIPSDHQSRPGIYHDQQLMQHLQRKGILIENQWIEFRKGFPDLWMVANPLNPPNGMPERERKLAFSVRDGLEYFNDTKAAFWHMQSSFTKYCGYYLIAEPLLERQGGRLPFPKISPRADNLKHTLLNSTRNLILRDQVTEPHLRSLKPKLSRAGVYREFFQGDLARKVFNDRVWWEEGVFA